MNEKIYVESAPIFESVNSKLAAEMACELKMQIESMMRRKIELNYFLGINKILYSIFIANYNIISSFIILIFFSNSNSISFTKKIKAQ